MAQQAIRIKTDPDPYEAFRLAQAYRVDNMIYVSGQAAFTLEGELVGVGDFDAQAVQTFENLRGVLRAGGDPGDPKAAFERTKAMEKFHHFTENLIGPDDAGDWIEMALAASSDDAQLARLQDRFLGLVPNP